MSCCATARSSTSTTGCSRSRRRPRGSASWCPRRGWRVGARSDGRAPARAGDARLLGEALRRAGVHHDRRVRPRRLQREHDDHRAGRHPRPLAAAPAARSGRPVAGAGLRLLPLPGGEAAHRDRPRAARHAGPALRPRRRHGDRDEGPRDPRGRQPARRRAVRPHRRRRLRPLRPPGRRGRPRVPRGRGAGAGRGPHRAARSTPTCRTTTSPRERLRLEMYKRLAEVRADEDVDALRRGDGRPVRRPAGRGHLAAARGPVPGQGAPGRRRRGHDLGQVRPLRPRRAARVARGPAAADVSPAASSRPGWPRSWCRVRRPRWSGDGRSRGCALLEWARTVIDAVIDPPTANPQDPKEKS